MINVEQDFSDSAESLSEESNQNVVYQQSGDESEWMSGSNEDKFRSSSDSNKSNKSGLERLPYCK